MPPSMSLVVTDTDESALDPGPSHTEHVAGRKQLLTHSQQEEEQGPSERESFLSQGNMPS